MILWGFVKWLLSLRKTCCHWPTIRSAPPWTASSSDSSHWPGEGMEMTSFTDMSTTQYKDWMNSTNVRACPLTWRCVQILRRTSYTLSLDSRDTNTYWGNERWHWRKISVYNLFIILIEFWSSLKVRETELFSFLKFVSCSRSYNWTTWIISFITKIALDERWYQTLMSAVRETGQRNRSRKFYIVHVSTS